MDYRTPELLCQSGMETSLIWFAEFLKKGNPNGLTAILSPTFVRCSFADSTLVYRYDLQPWMENPQGTIHGGIIASVLDNTMGSLSFYMAGEKITPTITLKVDYVSVGYPNLPVYVGCKCTRSGGTMAYLTCKAWQKDEERPFATADGVFFTAGPKLEKPVFD